MISIGLNAEECSGMEEDGIEQAIFGYSTFDITKLDEHIGTESWSALEWQAEFERSRKWLEEFLAERDPFVILARTALQFLTGVSAPRDGTETVRPLEQVEVEISQALFLMGNTSWKAIPTSPQNFIRYWATMNRHIHSYVRKQPEFDGSPDIKAIIQRKARLQTLYYRNLFSQADCKEVMQSLLQRIDQPSEKALGFRLSELFKAMVRIVEIIDSRMLEFGNHIRKLLSSNDRIEIIDLIEFFRNCYPLADQVWRYGNNRFPNLEDLRAAGFQMSEIAWPWVFTLDFELLDTTFDSSIVAALKNLSLPLGSLKNFDPQHIYLNNPIWKKPYIQYNNTALFIPLPHLTFSFPFQIIEGLIGNHSSLKKAYEKARADYLEAEVVSVIAKAMPSAKVHTKVVWADPENGKEYENDVVALLGNFVFVFEAKSGRISDSARRGGGLSLIRNFSDLFVEPGLQGWRLQNYLNKNRENVKLWHKDDKSRIDLNLNRPKVVFRFSVSFEHFTTLTSARYYLRELGLISNSTAWAPAVTLGELKIVARHLDTELSFQHYLTRRPSVDELIDFEGDEQDLLSIYLTNGLWIDPATIQDKRIVFLEADRPVRQRKAPRQDRSEPVVLGVTLSPLWTSIVRELYERRDDQHRFDIINVILNQSPPVLAELERNVRRARRGARKADGDIMTVKYEIGSRIFVLSCFFAKTQPDPVEFQDAGRRIMNMFADENIMVESVFFLFWRRSKEATFDRVSFYRYGFGNKPTALAPSQMSNDPK